MKQKKSNEKREKVFKESHVLVMLENMRDDIKLLAEGQMGIHDKLDAIDGRFEQFDGKFEQIDGRFDEIDRKLEENKSEHKTIMEYLSRLEDEMMDIKERLESIEKNKADKSDYDFLKRKMEVLERQMEKFKVLLKVKRA